MNMKRLKPSDIALLVGVAIACQPEPTTDASEAQSGSNHQALDPEKKKPRVVRV